MKGVEKIGKMALVALEQGNDSLSKKLVVYIRAYSTKE